MKQYISKSALVAEIERRITAYQKNFDKADNKIARRLEEFLSFIDSLQEEPKCIYNRTPEERERACKYCSANCEMVNAAESLGMTQEQYSKAVDELFYGGEVSEEMEAEILRAANNLKEQPTLHDWFRHFYLLGKQHQKYNPFDSHIQEGDKVTVNEDGSRFNRSQLERVIAAKKYANQMEEKVGCGIEFTTNEIEDAFLAGMIEGQKRMIKQVVEREVKEDAGGYPFIEATELYDYDNDKPLAKAGDKVKVLIIKDK